MLTYRAKSAETLFHMGLPLWAHPLCGFVQYMCHHCVVRNFGGLEAGPEVDSFAGTECISSLASIATFNKAIGLTAGWLSGRWWGGCGRVADFEFRQG